MRLIKLHLHPFAGTVNKTYHFQSGLNVVYGQNEAGKSTIVKSLLLVLLTPTNLNKLDFKSQVANFIPIGGDTIHIELDFEVGGVEYELKKSWGVTNLSSLNKVGQVGINDPNEVQAELFKLLQLNTSAVRDVLFTTQAKIASTIEGIVKDKDAEVVNSLDQILRSTILNTGDINPEKVKQQLTAQFENLTNNWVLDLDMPVITKNNKGAYENKWSRDVGEILDLAYKIYDKNIALEERIKYDENYTNNANEINKLKEIVNADKSFIDNNAELVDSLSKRKEILRVLETCVKEKEILKAVQKEWNAINAILPSNINNYTSAIEQLEKLREEISNARLAADSTSKIAQFDNIVDLKNKVEQANVALKSTKVLTDKDLSAVNAIYEQLSKAKAELSSLEAAQKFMINILPNENLEVNLQHSDGIPEKTNLIKGNNFSIEVNKGFIYSSSEVTIEVKSMTDQINTLNLKIAEFEVKYQSELEKYEVTSFQKLAELYNVYKEALSLYTTAKLTYDNALVGTSFDQFEQAVNKIKNLPKTRSVNELDALINELVVKIANLKLTIDNDNNKIADFVAAYENIDKVDDLRLEWIQKEKEANEKLAQLPTIDSTFNVDEFRTQYVDTMNRLKLNDASLKNLELERAKLDGGQPEVLASELTDEIELLQRQKNQKVEEAKAIQKVLNKLNEILERTQQNPYQAYELNLSQYLHTLSGGKYELSLSNMLTPHTIKNVTTHLELPIDLLSQGTSGVLGLSLRLAMADYYLEGQNGFLAFDDPMVDFDENRQELASQCFKQYAEKKQLFIFTCHQSHAKKIGGNLINL